MDNNFDYLDLFKQNPEIIDEIEVEHKYKKSIDITQNEKVLDLNTFNRQFEQMHIATAATKPTEKSVSLPHSEIENPSITNTFSDEHIAIEKDARTVSVLSKILFYLSILFVVAMVFSRSIMVDGANSSDPKSFAGYSCYAVLTTSMQNEIPKGSFVLVKKTNANKLQVGDTITFFKNSSTTVTHKIEVIYENYNGNGKRGFKTKGVNNLQPDNEVVFAGNIIGKVVFSLPILGSVLLSLNNNMWFCFICIGLLFLLSFSLRLLFKLSRERKQETAFIQSVQKEFEYL